MAVVWLVPLAYIGFDHFPRNDFSSFLFPVESKLSPPTFDRGQMEQEVADLRLAVAELYRTEDLPEPERRVLLFQARKLDGLERILEAEDRRRILPRRQAIYVVYLLTFWLAPLTILYAFGCAIDWVFPQRSKR